MSISLRLGLAVALQFAVLTGMIVKKEWTILSGKSVVLDVVPVDPRDLFRGDYVILGYAFSSVRIAETGFAEARFRVGETVYAILRRDGEVWRLDKFAIDPRAIDRDADDRVFLRGRVVSSGGGSARIEYGIESYFVPEGKGREIEKQAGHGLRAEVVVDDEGRAVVRGVRW